MLNVVNNANFLKNLFNARNIVAFLLHCTPAVLQQKDWRA